MKKQIGYKATNNFKCETLTYEIGKIYEIDNINICNYGFHYCSKIENVLEYYSVNKNLKIIEIEDIGDERIEEGNKVCTNKIRILREVPVEEHKLFKVDENGNITYYKDSDGFERWREYDKKGNEIYSKNSNDYEEWKEYDENNNLIHSKDSYGYEKWWKYDENNNLIYYKNSYGYEEWKEYDEKGNLIAYKDNNNENWKIKIK